ncbi:MAG: hypothetical protein WCE62_19090 [Polyangiales bacterium]
MAVRVPAALLRQIIRFALKPFLGPPFPVFFQRLWLRVASSANLPSRAAATAPERVILYLHGGGYCGGSWQTLRGLITHLAAATGA